MQQPDLNREGYAIFVRCCDLSVETSAGEFVATIEALDRILFGQIGENNEDFFPNPYGGAIHRRSIDQTLAAARALVGGLGTSGISAAIGIAWGRFRRTTNVHEWNAAALPLNVAARLAFCKVAVGRVFVNPHVRTNAGARTRFSGELTCDVKGQPYQYHAVESADYTQNLGAPLVPALPETFDRNIVLWDIVKYSTKDPEDQADLSHSLALCATNALHLFGAARADYSPAGDGGFAVFDSGDKALEFSKHLGKCATSRDIAIRTGIYHGEVAFTKRGPVGPAVLRADAMSAKAPSNGIAILTDVWLTLDKIAKADWQTTKIAPDILSLEPLHPEPPHREPRSEPPPLPITVPLLPPNYVERPAALASLRSAVLDASGSSVVALIALEGMGGIGKTVLAQALFKDEAVQKAFPDGRVWITVGREPTYDLDDKLREIVHALGGAIDANFSAESLYQTVLADKTALIVIDDIWNKSHLDPFVADSPRSRFLFTTRDASIARAAGAREHRADLLDSPQSRELLASAAGVKVNALPHAAEDIVGECAGLPLALSTMGALLRGAAPVEWDDAADRLRNADLSAIEEMLPPGQKSAFRATEVSVKALPQKMQQHYVSLAVLLDDMAAPQPILQTLWNVGEAEARRVGKLLVDRSLAQRSGKLDGDAGIRLHDLQLDFVRALYPHREALDLIRGAVRLSSNVIERHPQEFASQVVGRLLPHRPALGINQFVDQITAGAPVPWLRPLHPALHPPGTSLFRILEGSSIVNGVAVTPNGKRAVSASGDNTLKVWDLDSGRELRILEGHSEAVYGVAVTPDGKRAVSASRDNTLKVWDLDSGHELRTLKGHSDSVNGVAVTPDGKRAVSASLDYTLKVWDLDSGRELRTLEGHSRSVSGVAVTPDGKRAVSASRDNTLKVWDLDSGHELRTLKGHSDSVNGVAVTPDGKRAVSTSEDNTLKVWDLDSGRELLSLKGHSDSVSDVAVTPDGKRAVSASWDKTLKVWDLDSGRELRTLEGHSEAVNGVAVTPDGKRAVSASWDNTLEVWDLDPGRELRTLEGHSEAVDGVAVTPDGERAVSASRDNTLKVWDLNSGRELRTLEGHPDSVNGVAVTPDGKRAVSTSQDNTLKVWDLDSGRELLSLKGHGVAVTPDGKRAVSALSDQTLKVWDLDSGRELRTLEGHSDFVSDVAVTPDGKRAVSASWDKTLKVWDLDSGRELRTLEGHSDFVSDVAVTPDGKRAVSASRDNTLKVWDLDSGRELRTLEGHSESVSGVAVTPDGKYAVSTSLDKTLKVWDLASGAAIATFHCDAAAECCAFVDQHRIVAGDQGGRVYMLALIESGGRGTVTKSKP